MRVLVVASRYLPHRGGLETVVQELSKQLLLAGHVVAIVTNRYPRRLPAQERIDDIPVTRLQFLYPRWAYLKSGRTDLWLAGLFYFPWTLIQLVTLICSYKPDVVALQYLGSPALFIWLLKPLLHFPLVVSLHGGDVDSEPTESEFKHWLFCAVLACADRVTACSQILLSQALLLAPAVAGKSKVIHNGVDFDLFAHAPPFVHRRPYLLSVGQLEPHKGFDILLCAFAQICQELLGVELIIAGEGHQHAALDRQIQADEIGERAHLLGMQSPEQVASLMRGSLAVVIPSLREPFGIVALEALAAGAPIIASRVGGLVEALAEAPVTWVAPNDINGLAAAIKCRAHNPAQESRPVPRVRDWAQVASDYVSVFESALQT